VGCILVALVILNVSLLMGPWFPNGNVVKSTALLAMIVLMVIAASLYVPSASSGGTSNQRVLQEEQKFCVANVEILYQGRSYWHLGDDLLRM
jgi:hypothetical protein